jgi:hypothetical protein
VGFHSKIPASIEMRQGVTFFFVHEIPLNLICEPNYAHPTNCFFIIFQESSWGFSKFSVFCQKTANFEISTTSRMETFIKQDL